MLMLLGQRKNLITPRQIPGLVLWWDFSDLSTISQSGGFISQINDKSGSGNHGIQITGGVQPAAIAAGRNGRSIGRFDGVDDRLTTAAAIGGSAATFIFVGKSTKTASGVRLIGGTANGDPVTNGGFQLAHDDRGTTNGTNTIAAIFRTGSAGLSTDKFISYGRNGAYADATWVFAAAAYSANDKALWYNGVDQTPYDIYGGSAGVNAYVTSALGLTLGAMADGTVAGSLDAGDVLVYARHVGVGEIGRLRRYFSPKWTLP